MDAKLLWIVKDPTSKSLSRSSRAEEAQIRSQVQRNRSSAHAKDAHRNTNRVHASRNIPRTCGPSLPCDLHTISQYQPWKRGLSASLDSISSRHQPYFQDWRLPAPLDLQSFQLSDSEKRSLSFYIHRTAPDLSGWQDSSFWNQLALQAGQNHPGSLHAIIAIAAYHESSLLRTNPTDGALLGQLISSQCVKAFGLTRSSSSTTHASSLISCVILVVLQGCRGDYQAYRLLRSGAAMLEEVECPRTGFSPRFTGSARQLIDQELRPLIDRLQAKLCMTGDQCAALAFSARHRERQGLLKRDLPFMPSAFATLRDARNCLEAILNWGHDHVLDSTVHPAAFGAFCTLLEHRIKFWQDATFCIGDSLCSPRSLTLLEVAALNGFVVLSTMHAKAETDFDAHTSSFHQIMQLVTQLGPTNTDRERISFGIDCGLIDIVAFVGARCREPTIRQSALCWLRDAPRFEGDRLSSVSAHIIQAWIGLEQEGKTVQTASDIPELSRRRLLAGERYHNQRLLKLLFSSSPYEPTAETRIDVVWLKLGSGISQTATTETFEGVEEGSVPDVTFSPGHVAFLESAETKSYHHIHTTSFYFPIPRV